MKTWIISAVIAAALVSGVYALADNVFAANSAPQIVASKPVTHDTPALQKTQSPQKVDVLKKISQAGPAQIVIPSISLDAPIVPMGINQKGELDVPDGNTGDVGWWKKGPMPGEIGSAVLDAHVFAAFANLKHAKVGSDIYVLMPDGSSKRFVVQEARVFKLEDLRSEVLFGSKGYRGLNLITCAGVFDKTRDTYSHRLIVFAKLAE